MFTCIFQNSLKKLFTLKIVENIKSKFGGLLKNHFATYSENFIKKVKTYAKLLERGIVFNDYPVKLNNYICYKIYKVGNECVIE